MLILFFLCIFVHCMHSETALIQVNKIKNKGILNVKNEKCKIKTIHEIPIYIQSNERVTIFNCQIMD